MAGEEKDSASSKQATASALTSSPAAAALGDSTGGSRAGRAPQTEKRDTLLGWHKHRKRKRTQRRGDRRQFGRFRLEAGGGGDGGDEPELASMSCALKDVEKRR
ncbi:hypothetical protein NDU88_003382 [Pleurodeles waltl]|uniref:Uncharacterized protein n=1 Tax=Pleurodeles waltl TaxID=8319 RepID=A0AAV7LGY0_PLEWA|nr:hypothetical protein NDU88_003382 [Pleurodeles waltl]